MVITSAGCCAYMADGESVSVWFNDEESTELLENGLDELDGTRSTNIKDAIEVYLGSRDAGVDLGTDERNDVGDLRRWVHSMLIAYERDAVGNAEVDRRLIDNG